MSRKFPGFRPLLTTEGNFLDMFFVILCAERKKEAHSMKGYYTGNGYYGYVDGRYVLFCSESDYYEAMEDEAA